MRETLYELLSIQSTSDKTEELYKAIDFIEEFFSGYDVFIKRYEFNSKPSIVITSKNTKTPKIFLNGHIDVVPGDYDKAFEPYEKNGKIYARGACDMKGPIVALMYAFKELLENGEVNLDIGLMITSDEELGGYNGAKKLMETGYSAECVFVPDSGTNWETCVDEKGVWHFIIKSKGVSGHGSRPWEGENALLKLISVYEEIQKEFKNRWGELKEGNRWIPTVNLSKIHGGKALNSIPDYGEMGLDIRITGAVGAEEIENIVMKILKDNDCKLGDGIKATPLHTAEDNKYVLAWKEVVKEEVGVESKSHKGFGASDGRFFSERGVPIFLCLPKASKCHIKDEWIDYEDLVRFKDVINKWLIS